MEKFVVIDGNALIHRCFHALPPFKTSQGVLVNAVYGFTSALLSLIEREKPEYIAITFDKKGPTFRHELYKEYKATRVKAPDELYAQIPLIRKVVEAFNIPIFEESAFEADDLIGTLTKLVAKKQYVQSVILTGDMDTVQLIDETTILSVPRNGFSKVEYYDQEAVIKRYGVRPDQMIDYKALVGDTSDNIKGVSGIGPKTAKDLLNKYQTLKDIYENLAKLPNAVQEKLSIHRDEALQSRKLVEIVRDVPISFDLETCRIAHVDKQKVDNVLREFEFKRLRQRLFELFENRPNKNRVQQTGKSVDENSDAKLLQMQLF